MLRQQFTIGTHRVGSRRCSEYFAANKIDPLPIRGYPSPRPIPDHLYAAAERALANPKIAPTLGLPELRLQVANYASDASERPISADEVVITAGAMAALQTLWMALARPHGNVVVPVPSYFSKGALDLAHQVYRPVAALGANGKWDWEMIANAIDESTVAMYLVNPNNPTGDLLERSDFTQLLCMSVRHPDLWFVVDESYERLVYRPSTHETALSCRDSIPRLIVVGSFSKSFAMPWLRVGFMVSPSSVVPIISRVLEWTSLFGSHVTQSIALAAMSGDRSWLADTVPGFEKARDFMVDRVKGSGWFRVRVPPAGPFLYPTVAGRRHVTLEDVTPLWNLGLEVIPAECFGIDSAAVRVPFGGDEIFLAQAAEYLDQWATALSVRNSNSRSI